MLSDPKKLRTPNGFGYLVSWRDRWRDLDEDKARELAERLLDEPGNLEQIKNALGRPGAGRDELLEWLSGALAAGSLAAVRTRRKPPTMNPAPETDWKDMVGPDGDGGQPEPTETTWLELAVADELGEPVPGVAVRLTSGAHAETDAQGVARFDDVSTSFGRALIADTSGLSETLRNRWAKPREGAWLEPAPNPHLTVTGLDTPLPEFGLQARTRHTWIVQPRVERVRIVGNVFESNKAFVLPDALPLLRDVVALYRTHDQATFVVVGHTDTTGEAELNQKLSLERARVVQAYLQDDIDAWLSFYTHAATDSQRWGEREDALLLERALWSLGMAGSATPVRAYQDARGLTVDGDIGSQSRRALIEDYMALDGSTVPSSITMLPHGCGEAFPLDSDGETLDVEPPDGVDDPTDRRVELFVFDPPLGVLPVEDHPECYRGWQHRARLTHDMLVIRPLAVAVRVVDDATGAPVRDAAVSLLGVDSLGAGKGASTDAFGVRIFLDVTPGAFHIRAEKEGFDPASAEHQVHEQASPSVLTLRLAPQASLAFVVGVRDPSDAIIPMPQGVVVKFEHDGGPALEMQVDANGIAAVEAARPEGGVRISLEMGPSNCFLEAPDGARRMATLDEAIAESRTGSRFVQLPKRVEVGDPFLRLDGHSGGAMADVGTLIERARQAPIPLSIAPVWEHVCFTYFDRHHRQPRTVPGPTGPGEAALVMTGHPSGQDEPAHHSAWPVVSQGSTVHALAWFLPAGGFPLETDMIRMLCPPRTFVSTLRNEDGWVRMLTVEDGTGVAKQIDEPNPDRLLFYDLPQAWHCDQYFGRRKSDETKRPYTQLARQTAASSPILVSLDDVVVMRATSGSAREPVPLTRDFTVFNSALQVYKANERDPQDYGEPYFTDPERLEPPPGTGDVPAFVLLDVPGNMRALVHGDVFEAFDVRTTPEDAEVPVGARVAYSPFANGAAKDAQGWASKFCRVERQYRIPAASLKPEPFGKGSQGESSAALFRCVGSDSTHEEAVLLQYLFVAFDFTPKGPPPGDAIPIAPTPSEAKQRRLTAQSLHLVHARWSGRPLVGPQRVFENEEIVSFLQAPDKPKPAPSVFHSDDQPLRCGHVVFAFRGATEGSEKGDQVVGVWEGKLRASVGSGTGDIGLEKLGFATVRSTLCHEFGHVFGLPDEYVETLKFGSLKRPGFDSPRHVAGGAYALDVPEKDPDGKVGPGKNLVEFGAIMESNEGVRPRHSAALMASLLHRAGIEIAGGRWSRGAQTFAPLEPAHGLPGAVPDHFRRRDSPADAFLYVSGPKGFPAFRFHSSPPPEGVVVLECRMALAFPADATFKTQEKLLSLLNAELRRAGKSISCSCRLKHAGSVFNAAVVLAPRFLSRTVPATPTPDDRKVANAYLATVGAVQSGADEGIPPIVSPEEAAALRAELEQDAKDQQARVEELEAELADLEGDPTTANINILVKKDQIARAKKKLAGTQTKLGVLSASTEPERALTTAAYGSFVDNITAAFPPHVEIRWQKAVAVGVLGNTIQLPLDPDKKQLRQIRAALLEQFGLTLSGVTAADLADCLGPFFDSSPFDLVGVIRE